MLSNADLKKHQLNQYDDINVDVDDLDFDCFTHLEATDLNTGWELDRVEWMEGQNKRSLLLDQTNKLADLLEKKGIEARSNTGVVAISAVTNIITELVAFRPIRFLPLVAARDRQPMLNALRYWMSSVAFNRQYIRYVVITSGSLVPAFGDLRGRLKELSRKISKWSSIARKEYGIFVHFRGSEFTRKTAGERGLEGYDPDTVLYHPHANILLQPKRKLPKSGPGSWDAFLKWSHKYLDAHWKDCGVVKDEREIIKYVVKPADLLEGKNPLDADEAKWLYESLSRLNLAQPMGEFKEFCSDIAERRMKVVLVKNKNNNKGRLQLVRKSQRLDHSEKSAKDESEPSDIKPTNVFLGVTLPNWSLTPWAEPSILVKNFDPLTMSKASSERLLEIRIEQDIARMKWDRAGAPAPKIALQIAGLWSDDGSQNVLAFRQKSQPSYNIYNTSLTVPDLELDSSVISFHSSSSPPDEPRQEAPPGKSEHISSDPNAKIEDLELLKFKSRERLA